MTGAYLFDLDGTLLNTETLWVRTTEEYLFERHDIEISPEHSFDLVYGRSWIDIHADLLQRYPQLQGCEAATMADEMRPIFHALRETVDVTIHSSVNCLKRLAANAPVAIVSGSPRDDVRNGVEQLGLSNQIEFFLGCEDYHPGKPSPACYLLAAKRLKIAPANCTVFEDSTAGVQSAVAAGMHCVALKLPGAPEQDTRAAHLELTDLADFMPQPPPKS